MDSGKLGFAEKGEDFVVDAGLTWAFDVNFLLDLFAIELEYLLCLLRNYCELLLYLSRAMSV